MARPRGRTGSQQLFRPGNTNHLPDATFDALDQETAYTYNRHGQVTSIITPASLTTTNIYYTSVGSAGRLQTTIDLEISRTNAFTWYTNGLLDTHTDERGLTTTYYWDNLQRLTGSSFPDSTTTSNLYTYLDLTAAKDRLGYWSYSEYNSIRQRIVETNANGVVTGYNYCSCGLLFAVSNAWNTSAQMVTSYAYDNQGNRLNIYLPDATVSNWFDAPGRLIETCDAWGCHWFGYNNQGLLVGVTNYFGTEKYTVFDIEDRALYVTDANQVTVTNAYDVLGRLATRTYPDGGVEKFGYSARGLIAYTNQLNLATYYGYDAGLRKVAETNADTQVILYTNNAAGDLLSLTDGKLQTTQWGYDLYGRNTNKLDQAGTQILKYQYDADNRLTNRSDARGVLTYYAYDRVGNLTNVAYIGGGSGMVSFAYDALNREGVTH